MATFPFTVDLKSTFAYIRSSHVRALPWFRRGALAVLDQGLISGSGFLIGILMARWLAPAYYGAYALAFSAFLFLSGFHNALLLEPMSVIGPVSYDKCLPRYLGKLVNLHFALTVFLSCVLAAATAILGNFVADRTIISCLWGACVGTPLILLFWLCRRAAYLKLDPSLAVKGALVYCLAAACLLFLVKTLGWLSGFAAFLIQSLAGVAAACLLLSILTRKSHTYPGPSTSIVVRQHWHYGRWAVGTQIVYWLSGNAYYMIVAALLRIEDVAALRALQNFALPFGQFVSAVSLLLLPWASGRYAEEGPVGLRRRVRQMTFLFSGIALAYYIVLWVFGGQLTAILYAGRYDGVAYLLRLMVIPMVVLAASQASTIALQVMQSPSQVFLAYAVSGALTVLTGIPLTRNWGLPGAALGLTISNLVFLGFISYRCQARFRKEIQKESVAP